MAVTPVGNIGFHYIPERSAAQAGPVGEPTPTGRASLFPGECKTCASRKYVDRSTDASVSFQTPTHLSAGEAALAVAAHENEHVNNNKEKAEQSGMVAHSTVTISYGVCPECGRIYVAGGKTTTTFTPKQQTPASESAEVGAKINIFA